MTSPPTPTSPPNPRDVAPLASSIALAFPKSAPTLDLNPPLSPPPPAKDKLSSRLLSLDVFRGLVILTMLIVNNIGDHAQVGFFWKHADWRHPSLLADLAAWWANPGLANFPLLVQCALADYVMPLFMLIIGVALPFSTAASKAKGETPSRHWLRVVKRGLTLVVLGWAIGCSQSFSNWYHSTDPNAKLSFTLGMDVLQLLGVSYIVARLLFLLPTYPRIAAAALLFMYHWALLKYLPQGTVPAGTFTEKNNAVGYLYNNFTWGLKLTPWLGVSAAGMLSVAPAAATMTLGTFIGELLHRPDATTPPRTKVAELALTGLLVALVGVLFSLDLPMNKPRWSPGYLLYCSGVGAVLIALLYLVVDLRKLRRVWTPPLVALGVNAIGIYFISIFLKIWLLNTPKLHNPDGTTARLIDVVLLHLRATAGYHAASWIFTLTFVAIVWAFAALAYRHRLIWKV